MIKADEPPTNKKTRQSRSTTKDPPEADSTKGKHIKEDSDDNEQPEEKEKQSAVKKRGSSRQRSAPAKKDMEKETVGNGNDARCSTGKGKRKTTSSGSKSKKGNSQEKESQQSDDKAAHNAESSSVDTVKTSQPENSQMTVKQEAKKDVPNKRGRQKKSVDRKENSAAAKDDKISKETENTGEEKKETPNAKEKVTGLKKRGKAKKEKGIDGKAKDSQPVGTVSSEKNADDGKEVTDVTKRPGRSTRKKEIEEESTHVVEETVTKTEAESSIKRTVKRQGRSKSGGVSKDDGVVDSSEVKGHSGSDSRRQRNLSGESEDSEPSQSKGGKEQRKSSSARKGTASEPAQEENSSEKKTGKLEKQEKRKSGRFSDVKGTNEESSSSRNKRKGILTKPDEVSPKKQRRSVAFLEENSDEAEEVGKNQDNSLARKKETTKSNANSKSVIDKKSSKSSRGKTTSSRVKLEKDEDDEKLTPESPTRNVTEKGSKKNAAKAVRSTRSKLVIEETGQDEEDESAKCEENTKKPSQQRQKGNKRTPKTAGKGSSVSSG